jgi:hypothetical protein
MHHPAFYLKHVVMDTGFCLRFQVEPTQVGPLSRASLCLRATWVGYTWRQRSNPVSEILYFK